MSEMTFTLSNGFPSSNSSLPIFPSDSSFDAYLKELSPISLKSSLSNDLSLKLEPLEVEIDRSDALTVFPTGNLAEAAPESLSEQNSIISLGKFGDYDDWDDATLTLKDDLNNIVETFSLTGDGYGQVFKDDRSEYVFFWGTDETTSVQISARDDLQLNDYIGSSLQVQTQGSITTNNILSNGGTIDLTSTGETVTSQGDIATKGGWVKIEGVNVDVVRSQIEAGEVTLSANHNLNLEASQLQVAGDLYLSAQNTVQVSDSATNPFVAKAGGQLKLQGNQSIEIVTLNHPQTSFQSGGDLSLVSNGKISGDAHFSSQGNFAVLNLQAEAGQFASFANPVISTSGNVYLGNYRGEWLEVNAGGGITTGTIDTSSGEGNGGSITLNAVGNITTGFLSSYGKGRGGDITLKSSQGTIDTNANTLNASGLNGGGTIFLSASNSISTGNLYSFVCAGGSGSGGNITLGSSQGTIDTSAGELNAVGLTAGGAIVLTAAGDIYTSTLYSFVGAGGTGKGGDITLGNSKGMIDTSAGDLNASGLMGGTIAITSAAKLLAKDLKAYAWGDETSLGGNITLKAGDEITTDSLFTNHSGVVNIHLRQDDAAGQQSSPNVTTGNITATQVEILSDGGVKAVGYINTYEGDVDIMALKNITLEQITAYNGATQLTSGLGAIAATEAIRSDEGFTALAKGDITTNKIKSYEEVVILKSSQGAIAVNDTISSYGDVSLAAAKDVVAGEITSDDGGVALMSASGTVKANGAISSVEDVTLGAKGNLVARTITARLGTVALVSIEGTVTDTEVIDGGIDVVISAKQNVSAGQILAGAVAINSDQGAVTLTGQIVTGGDAIDIRASGPVVSGNLISKGGAITVVSELGAVTTGYLRSDGYGTGGKIYLQAFGSIRVVSSFSYFTEYSIYTGNNNKDWITIISQSSVLKLKDKTKFLIGNASLNGTLAQVSAPLSFKPMKLPITKLGWIPIIIDIFNRILDGGKLDPAHVDQINPITGERYADQKESELVEKLSRGQKFKLTLLIQNNRVKEKEVFKKGIVDTEHGCFKFELSEHLGDEALSDNLTLGKDVTHSKYATHVTGSLGDFLVITKTGIDAFYDGLVVSSGAIYTAGFQPIGSVAEVKTGPSYALILRKSLPKTHPSYLATPLTEKEKNGFLRLNGQIRKYITVADACHLNFFLSFSNKDAASAAKVIYQDLNINPRATPKAIKVYYLKLSANL